MPDERRDVCAEAAQTSRLVMGSRGARAATFVVSGIVLSGAAHRVGGGSVTTATLALAVLALVPAGWILAARPRRLGPVLLATVVGQVLLHAVFVAPAALAAVRAASGADGGELSRRPLDLAALLLCHHGGAPVDQQALRATAAHLDLSATLAAPPVPGVGAVLAAAVPMLVAHLVAAVALGWWLGQGERLLGRELARILTVVVGLLAPTPPRPAPVPVEHSRPSTPRWVGAHSVTRRGPPRQLRFFALG